MFQYIHSQSDNGVSTMITKAIRFQFSKDVSKNQKSLFNSKSFCIVSIIKMVANQGIYFFETHAGSVHSLGTNQESYLN